jgi:hypothetical protein
MEELAKMAKVQPNIPKYILTDPKLAFRLIFYGLVPYQYRLDVGFLITISINILFRDPINGQKLVKT